MGNLESRNRAKDTQTTPKDAKINSKMLLLIKERTIEATIRIRK